MSALVGDMYIPHTAEDLLTIFQKKQLTRSISCLAQKPALSFTINLLQDIATLSSDI